MRTEGVNPAARAGGQLRGPPTAQTPVTLQSYQRSHFIRHWTPLRTGPRSACDLVEPKLEMFLPVTFFGICAPSDPPNPQKLGWPGNEPGMLGATEKELGFFA